MSTENRRTEDRLAVSSECRLEVKSPSWAMLPAPLQGRTQNLTRHGAKVALAGVPAERFERWRQHVDAGDTLAVVLHVDLQAECLALPGIVVWLTADTPAESGRLECSLGVLLSLLPPEASAALRRVLGATGQA